MPQPPKTVSSARCYNHPTREAVAICTVTGHPYCRECIVEHEGRMVSAAVVAELLSRVPEKKRPWHLPLRRILVSAAGLLLLAYGFYLLGRILLAIPSRFHDGLFW